MVESLLRSTDDGGEHPSHEEMAALTTVPGEMQAAIVRSVLADAGIESWMFTASGPELGIFGLNGFAAVTVNVRARDLEAAKLAMEANRQDSVDLDWSEVDTVDPEEPLSEDARSNRRMPLIVAAVMLFTGALVLDYYAGLPGFVVAGVVVLALFLRPRLATK